MVMFGTMLGKSDKEFDSQKTVDAKTLKNMMLLKKWSELMNHISFILKKDDLNS